VVKRQGCGAWAPCALEKGASVGGSSAWTTGTGASINIDASGKTAATRRGQRAN
jgi:hypothetical protein